jgi:hypothetical protein
MLQTGRKYESTKYISEKPRFVCDLDVSSGKLRFNTSLGTQNVALGLGEFGNWQ